MATGSGVALQGMGNGVVLIQQGTSGPLFPAAGHSVFIYKRNTTTQVQVYSDSGLTATLTQPLSTGSDGSIPGYVATGTSLDAFDQTQNQTKQLNSLDASSVASVGSPVGRAAPPLYYDNTPNSGESPNFAFGTTLANVAPGPGVGYSNVSFGGGFRPGLSSAGNLGLVSTGYDNTAFGAGALVSLTTGHSNTGIGPDALSAQVGANANTAVGAQAGKALTSGGSNVIVGGGMATATTDAQNVAIGDQALNSLNGSTGACVAIGYQSVNSLASNAPVTAVGYQSALNIINSGNTALGYQALRGGTAGATNITNSTAIGHQALVAITSGNANVAVGYSAALNMTGGGSNVVIGATAGGGVTSGSANVIIGQNANTTADGSNMTLVGQAASGGGNQNTAVGAGATAAGAAGTALGRNASAAGTGSVAIGCDSSGTGASTSTNNEIKLGTANQTVNIPTTTAIGNGASTNLTALAKSTGGGPASDVVNAWIPFRSGATSGFIPFFV